MIAIRQNPMAFFILMLLAFVIVAFLVNYFLLARSRKKFLKKSKPDSDIREGNTWSGEKFRDNFN